MALQTIAVRLGRFTLAANAAYFHTDDYDSRLYAYERTTLYNFSFPSFFGEDPRTDRQGWRYEILRPQQHIKRSATDKPIVQDRHRPATKVEVLTTVVVYITQIASKHLAHRLFFSNFAH